MKRRITLINSVDRRHDWNVARDAQSHIVFAASFIVLRYALEDAMRELEQDVDRVIIDRTATPADFLDLLAHLAEDFLGDVVYVRDDQSGYLSATGRGGRRVLYALEANDLRFYLETHGLVATESVAAA
jgi:hypothetical protein